MKLSESKYTRQEYKDCIYLYRFTEVLQNIRKRHTTVVETLAQVS
jgi:hypothetical protein